MEQAHRAMIGQATVPARAALAGNPSDGHGGAVVAVPVPAFAASVEVVDAAAEEPGGGDRPADADLEALIAASLGAAARLAGMPPGIAARVRIAVRTSIPRSVGLAGSSAIVLGVLEAIRAVDPASDWGALLTRPEVLAVVAHDAEVTGLGIAAGLQDRLVQAHRTPLLMEFGDGSTVEVLGRRCGSTEPLPTPPGHLVIAHRATTAASSGVVHGELSRRSDLGPTMARLAEVARDAAAAIRGGSVEALGAAMDDTFDLRASVLELEPIHVEMVDRARAAGGYANYTGSGGAIAALCRDDDTELAVSSSLEELPGCTVTRAPLSVPATEPTAGGL